MREEALEENSAQLLGLQLIYQLQALMFVDQLREFLQKGEKSSSLPPFNAGEFLYITPVSTIPLKIAWKLRIILIMNKFPLNIVHIYSYSIHVFRGCCTNNNLYSVRFCCLAFLGGVLGAG